MSEQKKKASKENNQSPASEEKVDKSSEQNDKKDPDSKEKKKESILNRSFSLSNKVPVLDVVLSIRHLSIMLKSSMPLSDALRTLTTQAENPKLQKIYGEIVEDVEQGMPMAESMKKHPNAFTHIMSSVVSVGEQGGTLETNLIFLADFLKQNYELNRKVKGALTYPFIIFVMTTFEMLGVIFFIIPKLDDLFSSFENIPPLTAAVIGVTRFVRTNWYFILGAMIAAFIAVKIFLRTESGKKTKDLLALKFPIIKNLKQKHILTNFSRTLAILLESSIPISESLKIASGTVDNYVYQKAVMDIQAQVSEGINLANAMKKHSKLFPSTFTKMIEVGEETGSLEENLLYLHDFYAEEVKEMSNNLATLIEPLLLILIGLMLGVLALTIVAPIYQLTGSINAG